MRQLSDILTMRCLARLRGQAVVAALVIVPVMAACGGTAEPAVPMSTVTPTVAAVDATASLTVDNVPPSGTPASRPDHTSTPIPSPTPAPTRTPLPEALLDPDMAVPPGEALVWHDGATLWAATGTGSERVADVGAVSRLWVSPSARHLAYLVSEDSGWELWLADLTAGAVEPPRTVLAQQALAHVSPVVPSAPASALVTPWFLAWAPDDSAVVFTLAERWDEVFGYGERDDLWWLDAAGGSPRELLGPGHGGPAAFSRDGTRLAFTHPRHVGSGGQESHRSVVAVLDLSTALSGTPTPMALLEVPAFASESDWTVYHGLRWDPSGQAIDLAVGPVSDRDGWAYLDGPVDLVQVGLDGTSRTLAQAGPQSVPWQQFPDGYWSADGSRVAWFAPLPTAAPEVPAPYPPPAPTALKPGTTAGDACYAPRDLVVADADGGQPSMVAAVPHARLLWSPDGHILAFQPYWHDEMGRVHLDAWRLVEAGQAPTIRQDLSPEIAHWIGPNILLVIERQYDPDSYDPRAARLLLVALDGHWREIAPHAYLWATAPTAGVLGD